MIFAFLVSFFSPFSLDFGGQLYISELLLAVYFVLAPNKSRLLAEPFPKRFLLLGVLWLLSQILSDIFNETPFNNLVRGWASIVFFLVDFAAVYLMTKTRMVRIKALILGLALGRIFWFLVAPTDFALYEPWKWALGGAVTLLLLLYLGRKKPTTALLATIGLGVIHMYENTRSLGGILMLSGIITYLGRQNWFQSRLRGRLTAGRQALLVAVAVGGLVSVLAIYQWAAESGYLPETTTQKYQMTKSTKLGMLGLIIGGRIEILASTQAVFDAPILGHGSWAEGREYAQILLSSNEILGTNRDYIQLEQGVDESDLIPAHSYLMQAWVWSGILGAVFWFGILQFLFKSFPAILRSEHSLQPIAVYFLVSIAWNVLFSPFGSAVRVSLAIQLITILATINFKAKRIDKASLKNNIG